MDEALAALTAQRDLIDQFITDGLTGDPMEVLERLAEADGASMRALIGLLPDDDPDEGPPLPGQVVTVRSRTDYVVEDEEALLSHARRLESSVQHLGDAFYELLHHGPDLSLTAPGLRVSNSAIAVHTTDALPDAGTFMESSPSELLTIEDNERELRGIVNLREY